MISSFRPSPRQKVFPMTLSVVRFLSAVVLLGLAAADPTSAAAQTPQLVSLSVSPASFDTSAAPVPVTVTARITDSEGDYGGGGILYKPTCCADAQERFSSLAPGFSRISGDDFDGVYQSSIVIPQNSATGTWGIRAWIVDNLGHTLDLASADLATLGLQSTIENTAATGDGNGPVLEEFSISPTVVDAKSGPATVTFTMRVTDDWTGTAGGSVAVGHAIENGYTSMSVLCFDAAHRISGNANDGIYQCTYEVEQGALGMHTIHVIYPNDVVENRNEIHEPELQALGFPTRFLSGDCGNGTLDVPELCDDGNLDDTDGCESDCTPTGAVCGDGYLHATEQCDDGNLVDSDGCDSNCTPTGCGNGARTAGETCDDGNNLDDDGCESDCNLSVGILDPTYDSDGIADGSELNFGERVFLALQDDGSSVLAYSTYDGGQTLARLAVTRFTQDGALDTSFGTSGKVFTAMSVDVYAGGVVIQADGRIVVAGWPSTFTANDFILERYLSDGTLDPSFGSGGVAAAPPGTHGFPQELAVDGEGRILVAGGVSGETFLLARYLANGTVDSSFGDGGTVRDTSLSSAYTLAIQPDGKIVALSLGYDDGSGFAWRRVAVSRYLENGDPDTTFGDNGRTLFPLVRTQNPPGGLALQSDGKIVVGIDTTTTTASGFVALRLNADGSPDTTFHGDGISGVIDVDSRPGEHATGVVIGDDGKITLAGSRNYRDVAIARYLPNGSPDEGFVGKGWMTMGLADSYTVAEDIALDASGKLVITAPSQLLGGPATHLSVLRVLAGTCGDVHAAIADGEQCDDGNAADGDGCEADCTLTPVSQTVIAGGTASTGAEATASAPVQTAVMSPDGGLVSIAPVTEAAPLTGLKVVGLELQIEAPPATTDDPLVITLTIDVSALPPGITADRLEVLHNGEAIEDCTGTLSTASPDPCIHQRLTLPDGDVEITVLTSSASRWSMALSGLSRNEQDCVNEVGKASAAVAKAQGKVGAACLKAESGGSVADAETCLGLDGGGKVGAARTSIDAAVSDYCTAPPLFGISSAMIAGNASEGATRALPGDLLGEDIDVAAAIPGASKCQASALKAMQKLFDSEARLVLACAKSGLSGKSTLMTSADDLGSCLGSLGANPRFAKARASLAKAVDSHCPANPSSQLPGSCAAEEDSSSCLSARVTCRLCQMFNGVWALAADCDSVDNGFTEGSCQ